VLPPAIAAAGLRLAVPQTVMLDAMDETVASAFARALTTLSRHGARITELPLAELAEYAAINATGGFSAAEAFAWHRALLARRGADYDPRVRVRIERGSAMSAADYVALTAERTRFIETINLRTSAFDALICPTVPIAAPLLAAFAADADYARLNLLILRNPSIVNFLDRCAATVPIERDGEAPVGLMVVGRNGEDRRLLAIARGLETALTDANIT